MKHIKLTLLVLAVLAIVSGTAVALNPGTSTTLGVVAIQARPVVTTDQNKVITVNASDQYVPAKIVDANIATTAAVTITKLAPGTSGQFLLSNSTPAAAWTTLSGDVTWSAGASTVAKINGATAPASPSLQTNFSMVVSGDGAYTLGDTEQMLSWGGADLGTTTSLRFLQYGTNSTSVSATEATSQVVMTRAGHVNALCAVLRGLKLATANWTVTAYKAVQSGDPPWGGAAQALTVTINAGNHGSCDTNLAHSFAFAATDLLEVASQTSATDGTSSRPCVTPFGGLLRASGPAALLITE